MREQIDDDLFGYWKNGLKVYEVFPFPARQDGIDQATIRDGVVARPLSLKLSRYIMKSYFKFKRFRYVIVNFGVKPLIAHYTFDVIPSPKKSGIAAEDQLTFQPTPTCVQGRTKQRDLTSR